MLNIAQLNAWFPDESGAYVSRGQILHDVSLSILKGATTALVGESGSGKSVTALSILRLLEESSPIKINGSIQFQGEEILDRSIHHIRKIRGNKIAMIFQEPMSSLNPVYTIGNQLMEPLLLHRGLSQDEAHNEGINLLERTGIEQAKSRMSAYPHQLSGGQRQRVMIAMALACRPSLLIADEPTTALDVSIQAQILSLIKDLQQEYHMAMLLITHDLPMVRSIADDIYIMKDGRIVESGTPKDIFAHPKHPYSRHLLASIPRKKPAAHIESKALLAVHDLTCEFTLKKGWKGFLKRNIQHITAVDHANIEIRRGTTCGVIGESGSGKTTLGLALLKLVPSTGSIFFNNQDLQSLSSHQIRPLRSQFQIVFQDPFSSLSPRMTVGEIIEEGLRIHFKSLNQKQRLERMQTTLADVGLEADCRFRYPHEFSGGQRQRIAIARVIILRPELLILDEPTSALDRTIQAQIMELLKNVQKKYNLTYLFISHDLRVVRALSDDLIVMQNGKIVESGQAEDVFRQPKTAYARKLFADALCDTW